MYAYPNEAIDAEILTFEDAPPTWYTGRARGIALTCKPCNNTLGSTLDSDAAPPYEGGLLQGKVTIDGVALNVLFEATAGDLRIFGRPEQNPREASARFLETIQKVTDSGSKDWKGNLSWREPYSSRKARLAWLKAAYIVGFARFGYRWAFSPGLRIVRQQILNIDAELISSFKLQNVARSKTKNVRRIVAVTEPSEISSLAVQMSEHLVFLPRPDQLDFHDRFKKNPPPRSGRFGGREFEWPTDPHTTPISTCVRNSYDLATIRPQPPRQADS